MQILKNQPLTILLIAFIISALPIIVSSDYTSVALFFVALLITVRCGNAAAKNQDDTCLWMDAEWHSCEKNEPERMQN